MFRIPEEIINSIEIIHLATIPQTVLRFLQMANDESTSLIELSTLAGRDPALAAAVLHTANSPSLRGRCGTMDLAHCLTSVGTGLSRALAACLVVQNVFNSPFNSHEYDYSGFWGHSLRVAEVARAIAVEINYPDIEEARLAGLLHNIGQLLLLGGLQERYGRVLAASSDESLLCGDELRELGTHHCAVGAWLVDQWALSSFMADAILFHQSAADDIGTADTLSQIVWSAHKICHHYAETDPRYHEQDADFTAVHVMLGVDATTAFTLYQNSSLLVDRHAAALGISGNSGTRTVPYLPAPPLEKLRSPEDNKNSAYVLMAEMAHDLALMQPLQRLFASLQSETEILHAVREAALMLFGQGPPAFLMLQPEEALLTGGGIAGQPLLLQQIKIPLDSDQTLAVAVALGKKPPAATLVQESRDAVSLADVQVARILGSEGLLYVPLKGRIRVIGVMVYGVRTSHAALPESRLRLMTHFADTAAICLEEWREAQESKRSATATVTNNFARHVQTVIDEAANPLGIIRNYLGIVRKRVPDNGYTSHEINIISEEIDRITAIIGRMGDVPEETAVVTGLDVNNLIEGMIELHGDSLFSGRGIKIEKDLDAGLSTVACDRDRIRQILYYLWKNASEATAAGGYFVISTHDNVNQDGRFYIEIRLSDTGPGLPPEVMRQLFRPSPPDERYAHAGPGLSIVAALVTQIDGRIACQSKTGRGTRFSILIPKSEM